MATLVPFLVLLFLSPAAYAATIHTVGDNIGWNQGVDYGSWASGRTFTVGDSLLFNYDSTHAVDEVSQDNYKNCNIASPISSQTNSPTTIPLTATGTRYFICPRSNHCSTGMKVAVNVVAASGGSTPPSTPGTPSTPGSSTPPSTPSGTRTPPPSGNGAAAISGGWRSGLVVGLGVALVGLLGVRG